MGIVPNVLVMDFINYVTDHVSFGALVARKLKAKFVANLQKAFRISQLLLLFFNFTLWFLSLSFPLLSSEFLFNLTISNFLYMCL